MFDQTRFLRGNQKAASLLLFAVIAGTAACAFFIAQALLISKIVDRVFLRDQTLSAVTYLLIIALFLMLAQYSASSVKHSLRDQVD